VVSKAQIMDKDIKVLAAQNEQFKGILEQLEKRGIIQKNVLNDEKSPK
jgi:hypothetical protein